MPTDQTENQKDNPSNDPVSDGQPISIHVSNPNSGKEHTGSNQAEPHKNHRQKPRVIDIKHIPKIDVIEGVEANQIARSANNISRWSVSINGLIFAVTAALAIVAVHQYTAANNAAQTAQNTLTETKKFDSITLANQKVSNRYSDSIDSIKSKHDDSVFQYQKKSLGAQITAIHETQKEFVKENEPFLEAVTDTTKTQVKGDNIIRIFYKINSL